MARRFQMHRDVDVNGVSGDGFVAEGILLDDGRAVVHWRGDKPSYVIWPAFDNAVAVHSHNGSTRFEWLADLEEWEATELTAVVNRALERLQAFFPDPQAPYLENVRMPVRESDQLQGFFPNGHAGDRTDPR
jgi:hypothetical protein